eukprot:5720385-Pyramimonas_sp.AAC.1
MSCRPRRTRAPACDFFAVHSKTRLSPNIVSIVKLHGAGQKLRHSHGPDDLFRRVPQAAGP